MGIRLAKAWVVCLLAAAAFAGFQMWATAGQQLWFYSASVLGLPLILWASWLVPLLAVGIGTWVATRGRWTSRAIATIGALALLMLVDKTGLVSRTILRLLSVRLGTTLSPASELVLAICLLAGLGALIVLWRARQTAWFAGAALATIAAPALFLLGVPYSRVHMSRPDGLLAAFVVAALQAVTWWAIVAVVALVADLAVPHASSVDTAVPVEQAHRADTAR